MVKVYTLMSTGLKELDDVITGVRPGDNIVWQVDSIDDYILFVHPFARDAFKNGKKLIYFRFADHEHLIPEGVEAQVYDLHPEDGFETFISDIFSVIEENGPGAFYIFDLLSELAVDWYSDRMLGNFFMLTCPYLYDYDTATYFALMRNHHTTHTTNDIHNTAQVVIDVYKKDNDIYLHPIKVFKRHTDTMYMLHHWKNNVFQPVTSSTVISEILREIPHPWLDLSISRMDMWNRVFERARVLGQELSRGREPDGETEEYRQRLLRMIITRDERVLELAEKYLDLTDLIDIGSHMIGTGLIGGKTIGMLLARAILKRSDPYWKKRLEPHDSFFIGSDVFYTYLIQSKCWWVRWKQKHAERFLEGSEEACSRLLSGSFPEDIQNQFKEVLNYFGQSPIIVRSSSLLEDAYGNSFSGKYESVFCANQGTPDERLEEFMNAVRKVYASTMSREALLYRFHRGLLDRDEQMALLVQRVSGSIYGDYFFPQSAGVGFSYNLYVWDKDIDPKAGVLRLVFGLGTRAVDRHDDDYTRIVALNEPGKRPEASIDEVRKYTQRKIDVLNLRSNRLESSYFSDIANGAELPLELFASRDKELHRMAVADKGKNIFPWIITFDGLFSRTRFIEDMKQILRTLQDAYEYPVDIEFTLNFTDESDFRINLLQCRPFQVKKGIGAIKDPGRIDPKNIVIETTGPIIGISSQTVIDRLIYVVPETYSKMSERDRYLVAKLTGKITNSAQVSSQPLIMLLGPGRWGTTTPALGVPVSFGEINNVSVICEIAEMHEGLVPDVSLGTHFFNDLVELDIQYLAIHPGRPLNTVNKEFLMSEPNRLEDLFPSESKWSDIVRVIDSDAERKIILNTNTVDQKGICYIERTL